MIRYLVLIPMLAACVPAEGSDPCRFKGERAVMATDRRIAETKADIARGYSLEWVTHSYDRWGPNCGFSDDCSVDITRREKVPLDAATGAARLERLQAERASRVAALAACR